MNDIRQQVIAWAYIDVDGKFMDAIDHQHGAYQTPLCKCVPDLDQILHDPENQPSQYGTVPMDYPEKAAAQAARQMRDAAVKVCEGVATKLGAPTTELWECLESIAALPIIGEEK